jgi:hypothetical protein
MLDDVTEIEKPVTQSKPRAPASSKAAINYLIASGASAISITTDVDGAAISVSEKILLKNSIFANDQNFPEVLMRSFAGNVGTTSSARFLLGSLRWLFKRRWIGTRRLRRCFAQSFCQPIF